MNVELEKILPYNITVFSPGIELAIESKPNELVIDLKSKRLLYVKELNYIVNIHKRISDYGGKIMIINASKTIKNEMGICGLDRIIDVD